MLGLGKKKKMPFVSAVLLATETGWALEDFHSQDTFWEEVPIVVRAIDTFCRCQCIDEVILVCREEAIPNYYSLVQEHELDKVVSVVGGGKSRQQSVFNGIASCHEGADFYAIHDAARPLVEASVIQDCLHVAIQTGAAAAGVPVKDTIKICSDQGIIVSTPNRAGMITIQTPQIFHAPLYRAAMQQALSQGKQYGDDCQLVEQTGQQVCVSPGSYENIRITTSEDLLLAASILRYREEGPH